MSSQRLVPWLVAGGVGIVSGIYIWGPPLKQEATGMTKPQGEIKDGRSQAVKDQGSSQTPYRHGGSQTNDLTKPNVAGTSAQATKSNTVDRDAPTRSNPNVHDGSAGGGVGVAEMRERKMQGQGLPSPQGGDTKAQVTPAQPGYNDTEGGGQKKGRWYFGGW
ncbi:hypothetical protein DB88DRAFT_488018 [Papiliotrema laurentii]|uniref:Uncharacterized protein n=1 Tax=Papiliotrema laurentii TaxID=5418 RepID=A0AAD9FS39_PAPLA|nr:hypothetical protein DB88DRAFT_488018 [Papiliotrema laurentii]